MLKINNSLTADIFIKLRGTANFDNYKTEDIEVAIEKNLFSIVVYDDDKPIGMGRIVGDDRIAFFIKDVIVDPQYQHMKVGNTIMTSLLDYIKSKGCEGAYTGLMSTPNKENFYKKYGFIERPNDSLGSGMVKFLSK
ncbi:Ribosomal-protein-alanine acetyltransferase [Marinilactibacillus psychrotolerans 42ea]|uniref:Ribosomal-protein-alanine acetyltransferase n=1 Tax=Marinilactibacillus psychrotolerans 42ea TaxID=1255609 RepID=A0A1R4KFF8_9LACT|nr:GNAT family N-acetyltransferase [Marinilactibacillus psychrotolerans]SJN43018.1 Ribosomal-protein-alanine acetyltransferase [Marinilactibacillus psychrotolerans 42ea]